jgi:RNA polymerase sigma-70 factor, ECF subfamily
MLVSIPVQAKSVTEPELAAAQALARAAWPGLDVPGPAFARALTEALANATPPGDIDLSGLHVTDLYLACGCVLGLAAATQIFVGHHLAAVPRYLASIDPSPWLAEEVTQELAEKLLVAHPPLPPRLASYGGRGPLESWVAVAAQRAALSMLRQRDPVALRSRASSVESAMAAGLDPELRLARAEVKLHFEEALRTALGGLGSRERMLLRLSLVSNLSYLKIGKVYGVNASTIARWIMQAREELLERMQRHLKQTHGLDPSELGSLLGLARSQIELSLSGALKSETSG